VLPLTERAVAAITCAMPLTFRVETSKLVETDLPGRVLCAEDATALPAVMAAVEEAKRHLARRC
jgi:NADPH-dependent ferric siderophore reductase